MRWNEKRVKKNGREVGKKFTSKEIDGRGGEGYMSGRLARGWKEVLL